MGDAPPRPPANQPEPRAQESRLLVAAGFILRTAKDWFLRFTNIRQLANGHYHERVDGIRVSLAASVMSAVTLGWYHTSTVGGSLTHVKGQDFKLGLISYLGFISGKKTEITRGSKYEGILGLKVTHVTGKKNKFQGSNRLENSALEKAEFTNKCAEYWALRKELATALKETIAKLEREHQSVEESLRQSKKEYDNMTLECSNASFRATMLSANISNLRWQADTARLLASSDFKVIAGSAAEFIASATWEGDFGSQLKLHCSMQEFAASISKLG